jgi:hypothetical protein
VRSESGAPASFAAFHRCPEEFLWYLQGIRGKLKTNRTTVRIRPQVLKKIAAKQPVFAGTKYLIFSW